MEARISGPPMSWSSRLGAIGQACVLSVVRLKRRFWRIQPLQRHSRAYQLNGSQLKRPAIYAKSGCKVSFSMRLHSGRAQ